MKKKSIHRINFILIFFNFNPKPVLNLKYEKNEIELTYCRSDAKPDFRSSVGNAFHSTDPSLDVSPHHLLQSSDNHRRLVLR